MAGFGEMKIIKKEVCEQTSSWNFGRGGGIPTHQQPRATEDTTYFICGVVYTITAQLL